MTRMQTAILVALGVAMVLVGWFVVAASRGRLPAQELARELDGTLVENYCRLVAEGRFAEAYEQCLTADYRREVSVADFVAGHERRRAEVGPIQKRSLLLFTPSRNLFTGRRELQVLYAVQYPSREERLYLVASDADGPFRLDGTYVSTASGSLHFKLW